MEKVINNEDTRKDIEELSRKTMELYAEDKEFHDIPAVENLIKFLMGKEVN